MNLNKKFMTFMLAFTVVNISQVTKTAEIQKMASFVCNEAINDVTDFVTKDGIFCKSMRLLGTVGAAEILLKIIDENVYKMNEKQKKFVRVGLVATAYLGTKLNKLRNQ